MKANLTAAAAGLMIMAMPSMANAATFVSFDGTTGTYGNDTPGPNTRFLDTLTFNTASMGVLTITFQTVYDELFTNLKAAVRLNDTLLTGMDSLVGGVLTKDRSLVIPVSAGMQTITVAGAAMANSTYAGTLSFAATAIPEPAAWSLMIVGLGGVGVAMRRRQSRARVAVSFA